MLVYTKSKKEARVIDFRESAPMNSDENLFQGNPENGIRGKQFYFYSAPQHAIIFFTIIYTLSECSSKNSFRIVCL